MICYLAVILTVTVEALRYWHIVNKEQIKSYKWEWVSLGFYQYQYCLLMSLSIDMTCKDVKIQVF